MRIIAHRGAHEPESPGVRENTVEAFRRAAGADGVELDVRRTADGALVVHHEPGPPGLPPIAESTRAELPAWLPSLAGALDACQGLAVVHVEIKASPLEPGYDATPGFATAVVAELEGSGRDVVVSSFNLVTLDAVRAAGPSLPTAWLTIRGFDQARAARDAAAHGHGGINPPYLDVTPELVDLARALGLQVNTWTVNDDASLLRMRAAGVDAIVTDVPARARALLGA